MENITHNIIVIHSPRFYNSLATTLDIFEKGKILGVIEQMNISQQKDKLCTDEEIIKHVIDSLEHIGHFVSFAGKLGSKSNPYINKDIRIGYLLRI